MLYQGMGYTILALVPVAVYAIWAWHNAKKMEIAVAVKRLELEQAQLAFGIQQHEAVVQYHVEQRQAVKNSFTARPFGGLAS